MNMRRTFAVFSSLVLLCLTIPTAAALSLGDVDSDGRVDSNDASLVLSEYALVSTGQPGVFDSDARQAADVNIDGQTDSSDASIILDYFAYVSTGGDKGLTDYVSAAETPTEVPTEAPTEAPTEPPTEPPTEAPTQPPTEPPTQPPTEPPTEWNAPVYVEYHFRNEKLLNQHWEKHGAEFGAEFGYTNAKEYEKGASDVINDPTALSKTEAEDGDFVFYIEATNEFVVLSTDGFIRTYFRPDKGKRYYDKQ